MRRSLSIVGLLAVGTLALTGGAPSDRLPPCVHGPFAGITETLADGTIIGKADPRDWGCAGHGGGSAPVGGQLGALDVPPPPPQALCFSPAAPNPATSSTRLQFTLPAAGRVSLVIYGRSEGHGQPETFLVRTLFDRTVLAGSFANIWDLKDDRGIPVPPGIYRAVLLAGDDALCGDIEVR